MRPFRGGIVLRGRSIVGATGLTALMVPVSGCIIWPNYCVEQFGVKSRVVDADSGDPIRGVAVQDNRNLKRVCTSNDQGEFRLRPIYHWHGGYWFAGIGLKILPLTHDVIIPSFAIDIVAQGYEAGTFAVEKDGNTWPGRVASTDHSIEGDFDGTYFVITRLSLKRVRPATTQYATTSAPAS